MLMYHCTSSEGTSMYHQRERTIDSANWARPIPAQYQSLVARTSSSRIPPRGNADSHPYFQQYDASFADSAHSRPTSSSRHYNPPKSAPSSIDSPTPVHSASPSLQQSTTYAYGPLDETPPQAVTHASLKYIHTLLLQHQAILEQHSRDIDELRAATNSTV